MKSRNRFVKASLSDGKAMLALIEETAAAGKIELLYTRRPDPYVSYMKESPEGVVIGLVKNPEGEILGQCVCVIRTCYVHGRKVKTGYLCGVRKSRTDTSLWDWKEIIETMRKTRAVTIIFPC